MQRVLSKVPRSQEARADLAYWRSRTMTERLTALQLLRLQHEGLADSPDAEPRLQRVCRVTQRTRG